MINFILMNKHCFTKEFIVIFWLIEYKLVHSSFFQEQQFLNHKLFIRLGRNHLYVSASQFCSLGKWKNKNILSLNTRQYYLGHCLPIVDILHLRRGVCQSWSLKMLFYTIQIYFFPKYLKLIFYLFLSWWILVN